MTAYKISDPSKTIALIRRAFFLAYNACGGTVGMGRLRAVENATEEQVWKNVLQSGDYPVKAERDIATTLIH